MLCSVYRKLSYEQIDESCYPLAYMIYVHIGQCRDAHLCRLPSHHHELFRALHQEARESVTQDCLDLIGLLHSNTNSHTVDAGFNKTPLLLIPANRHWVEQQLFARPARGAQICPCQSSRKRTATYGAHILKASNSKLGLDAVYPSNHA